MSLWYPSVLVNLRIRFDEAFLKQPSVPGVEVDARLAAVPGAPPGVLPPAGPAVPPPVSGNPALLTYGGRFGQAPRIKERPLPNQGPEFVAAAARSSATGASPQPEPNITVLHALVPLSAAVQQPTYRQAGTFSLTFAWEDLPVDPMLVRSCGVDIFMDTVGADAFAAGMSEGAASRARARLTPSDSNLRMTGLVDEWSSDHLAGDKVTITGRDLRCIFMDSPMRTGMMDKIDATQVISRVVAQIISFHPFGARFTVTAGSPEQWPGGVEPIPGKLANVPRVRQSANGRSTKMTLPGDPNKMTFWDLITQYCQLVGGIPYITTGVSTSKAVIRIASARDIFDRMSQQGTNPFDPPPFAGQAPRVVPTGVSQQKTLNWRWMVYGRDLSAIKFKRKYTGHTPKIVEVTSWNPSAPGKGAQKLLQERWPQIPDPDEDQNVQAAALGPDTPLVEDSTNQLRIPQPSPSGNTAVNQVIRISRPGISSREQLRAIAFAIFTEIAHGELAGTIETSNLASFGGSNSDPDLLSIKVGDPITLDVDARRLATNQPAVSQLANARSIPTSELIQQVFQKTGNMLLARLVALSTQEGGIMQVQPTYRVSAIKWDWKGDGEGATLKLAFDFQEYVVAATSPVPSTKTPETLLETWTA